MLIQLPIWNSYGDINTWPVSYAAWIIRVAVSAHEMLGMSRVETEHQKGMKKKGGADKHSERQNQHTEEPRRTRQTTQSCTKRINQKDEPNDEKDEPRNKNEKRWSYTKSAKNELRARPRDRERREEKKATDTKKSKVGTADPTTTTATATATITTASQ